MSQPIKNKSNSLVPVVSFATISRFVFNTARRFPYPFAAALGRGLNVSLGAVTSMIAINQATAVLAIFLGPVTDKVGSRRMMLVGLTLFLMGMGLVSWLPTYTTVLIALFLAGLAKGIFDPAIQSYIGQRVPFERRARVVGIMEFAWAGATLLGIPAIGVLMDRFGWRSSFYFLAIAGAVCWLGVRWSLGPDKKATSQMTQLGPAPPEAAPLRGRLRKLLQKRVVRYALGFALLFSLANDFLFVVYGSWLEQVFQLDIVHLGVGTGVIGIAELASEGAVAAIADRLGVKRSVIFGALISIVAYLALPFLDQSVYLALAGLFVLFFGFEFAIVSFMSLSTELVPNARAAMISAFFAASGIGRVVGALAGGWIWLAGGMLFIGIVCAVLTAAAVGLLIWGLARWQPAPTSDTHG